MVGALPGGANEAARSPVSKWGICRQRIFQALERAPGAPLRVILPHEPVPLYSLLRERGYSYAGAPRADGGFEVLIERS